MQVEAPATALVVLACLALAYWVVVGLIAGLGIYNRSSDGYGSSNSAIGINGRKSRA